MRLSYRKSVKLVIIIRYGTGGTVGNVLHNYAKVYQEAGYATLLYDFRSFAASQGQPRQVYSIKNQLEDLSAAIEFARNLDEIKEDKIVLWGTSAAGGYGLIHAASDKAIAGIIGQCPALDNKANGELSVERQGYGFFLKLFMHAQRDKGRSRFALSEHKIPIVGHEGDFAFVNAKGAYEGYESLIGSSFVNEICVRSLFLSGGNNPIDFASEVECPVQLLICEKDNLVDIKANIRTADLIGDLAEVKLYDCGHFDIYQGEFLKASIKDQLDFLNRII